MTSSSAAARDVLTPVRPPPHQAAARVSAPIEAFDAMLVMKKEAFAPQDRNKFQHLPTSSNPFILNI